TVAIVVIAIAAGLYQLLAVIALLFRHPKSIIPNPHPPSVSILKPVYGKDAGFYQAIRTHALQKYPEFEILFGIRRPDDPARAEVERLIGEFPALPIRLVLCTTSAPNLKVGSLIDLAREARHALLIVNDSDISVPPGYIGNVTAPLSDAGVGLVTCLYRAEAHDWPSRFEGLAIATDFAPSTLVARLFGVSEFGLGSTLAFRRSDLDRIGGFQAIADYLADDYQLGHQLHALGLRNIISEVVVSTRMSSGSWLGAWRHQVRWARTIRLAGGAGYAGLPITYASLWVVIAALFGHWEIALALLGVRLGMAIASGWWLLESADVWKYCYAIPLRDLCGVAVWAAGLVGRTVVWRDQRLRLDAQGRIISKASTPLL
ncbi:MAG TPA: bacteriohopanetetrol glucosamine biosynthesis glycosyltransferase HpnI, partial [Bryobacteraceae bacterium]|nr:bacteriohopanetetrol glucosamine biosynthesis glycosyltransferase HpnI [Bryobacteraceae bacterium]